MLEKKKGVSRRDFFKISGSLGVMGMKFLAGLSFFSCKGNGGVISKNDISFPSLEITGSYYDIGYKTGKAFSKFIHLGFERRKKWFGKLKDYIRNFGSVQYKGLLDSAKHYFPHLVEELRGWADGCGLPFDDLMILNCKPEISAMMKKSSSSGCSTIVVNSPVSFYIGHNEDGPWAYNDLMFMLKVTPQSGVTFLSLSYPGILPGKGPSINNYGIIMTTNYIGCEEWKIGVPRYFLDRAMLEAKTINEAIKIATHEERAYSYHHILASIKEKRVLSLECSLREYSIIEIKDIYYHTNHFVHEKMKSIPQFYEYVAPSSTIRYQIIEEEIKKIGSKAEATPQWIVGTLASHRGSPYSPCLHQYEGLESVTLASSLFDSRNETLYLYKNNPCKRMMMNYRI